MKISGAGLRAEGAELLLTSNIKFEPGNLNK